MFFERGLDSPNHLDFTEQNRPVALVKLTGFCVREPAIWPSMPNDLAQTLIHDRQAVLAMASV
jgi:hypothetical protein